MARDVDIGSCGGGKLNLNFFVILNWKQFFVDYCPIRILDYCPHKFVGCVDPHTSETNKATNIPTTTTGRPSKRKAGLGGWSEAGSVVVALLISCVSGGCARLKESRLLVVFVDRFDKKSCPPHCPRRQKKKSLQNPTKRAWVSKMLGIPC